MSYGDYPDLSGVKKILVIKLRQLGDVLLTGPVFRALKNRFPNGEIDAFIYSEGAPLIEDHPAISSVIGYDRLWKKKGLWTRIKNEWSILRRIRKKGYDLVINLTEGDRGAVLAKISKARIRVGFDPKKSGFLGKKSFYTHLAKQCPTLRHTVEKNLDILRRIGIFPSGDEKELFLPIKNQILAKMKNLVGTNFLLIHPTSRWRFKCLPIQTVRAVTQYFLSKNVKIIFTGGMEDFEKKMVDEITSGLDVTNLTGKIILEELSALIFLSGTVFCVDSLPFHMASALKKEVVCVFGPTSDVTWGAWQNPNATVLSQSMSCRPCYLDGCGGSKVSDCLASFPVQAIIQAIEIRFDSQIDLFRN